MLYTNQLGRIPTYSAVHGFWLVKESGELVDGLKGCGKVERGGCLFAQKFIATRTTVLVEVEGRTKPNTTLSQH